MARKPRPVPATAPTAEKPRRDPARNREIAAELEVALAMWRRGGDDEALKATLLEVLKRLEST